MRDASTGLSDKPGSTPPVAPLDPPTVRSVSHDCNAVIDGLTRTEQASA